jgi:hypothetical protein
MRNAALICRVLGLVFASNAVQALAHHSFSAEFDANQPLTVTGTVTRVEWMNPHTWFYVDVKDDSGATVSWGFELASPNLLMRNGWTRSAMKTGDVVTVEAFRAKNGSNNANARTVTLDGTGQRLFTGSSSARREP